MMMDAPGCRYSMPNPRNRSAPSRSRRRIPISFTWRQARVCIDRICRWAMAYTARAMAARLGCICRYRIRSRFPASRWIRMMPIAFTRPCSAILMGRARSAGYTDRPMAAPRGRRCWIKARTPALHSCASIPSMPELCTRDSGMRAQVPGKTRTCSMARMAGCSSRPMAVITGGR